MIIEIVGKPRSGKTALNTLFMYRELIYNGRIMLWHSRSVISGLNKEFAQERDKPLAFPYKPPILANYEAHIRTGFDEVFEPYWLNPYTLGVPTPQTSDKIQFMPPCSCLHITEGRKYWDGRESSSMPDNVSRYFETHGHNYLTIIIDAQRGKALDLNIRENANRFIEVQGMVNDEDAYGRILRSRWYCREFYSLQDYEAYLVGKTCYYRNTMYSYEGNIFELYKSRNCQHDFVPPKGRDYSLLEFVSQSELHKLNRKIAEIYDTTRPKWYRNNKATAA